MNSKCQEQLEVYIKLDLAVYKGKLQVQILCDNKDLSQTWTDLCVCVEIHNKHTLKKELIYKVCTESNTFTFVSILPVKASQWNKTQNIAHGVYFVSTGIPKSST